MTESTELRTQLDIWVAARLAYDALETVMELEPRAAYPAALRQLFSAELDAAEHLVGLGIELHVRGPEDPPPALGSIDG